MDILQYINKMNRLYGSEPAPIPAPRYNTQQYLQGGRVGKKPGGLVEPGVTHYGRTGSRPEPLNAEQLEVMKKMYKVETEAEAIEKFGKKKWYSKKSKIRSGIFTGTGSGQLGTIRRDPSTEWLKFSQDPKFEEFFTQQIKMAGDKAETTALRDLKKVMNKYKLTAESPVQDIFEKFVLENHKALTKTTEPFISFRSFHKTVTDQFNVFKRNYGTMSIREFTESLPAMKGYKNPIDTFTKLKIYSKYTDESLAKMDPGSVAYRNKVSAQKQGRIFMQALKNHGIEVTERAPIYEYQGKTGKKHIGEVRIKATPEQLVSFNDSNYWENVYKSSPEYKAKITKLSKADPTYKLGGYGEHLGNLTKLQKNLNNVLDSKTFEELVKWVDENPKLKDMVEAHFNRSTLEMEKRPLQEMSEGELRQRVRFQKDHIRGRTTVGYDKISNKILDGIGVEFPKNYHIIPGSMNFPTKFNVENAVKDFPHETEKIKKLEQWFEKKDISFWDQNTKTYRGAVPKATSAYTSHLGIEMEKLLKSEAVFPEWHKRAGHPIVEDRNLWAKIEKANLAMSPESKGLLGEGWSKFATKMPKTAGALGKAGRFLFHPVEMGAIPLAIAAEGLYANYANKRDLKKALDQMDIPQYKKNLLLEGYRQEARDIGGVGLEDYAIDKPNISGALEKIGYGDKKLLMQHAKGPIADVREQDALKKEIEKQRIEDAYKREIGRRTVEFKKGGRVSFKFGTMGRRGFLKLLAALGIGTAGAKAGLFGLSKIAGKKAAVKTGVDIATGTQGMPTWFPALVNRVIKEGDDVSKKLATVEREIVHTKKISKTEEVTVYNNLDTGNVRVEYGPPVMDKKGNIIRATNDNQVVHLEYKAPEVIDEGKHIGKKTDPEFSAAEAKPRVTNWEGDIEWEHMDIDKNVGDLLTDTSKLKTFAKKKLTHKDKVIAKKKQKYHKKLEKDPSEQLEYIEKKEGATIDDLLDEGKRVGEFDPKGYDPTNEVKGMNLPKKKTKKASGGRVDYDNYLPDIEDIE